MKAEEIILAVSKNTSAMESLSDEVRREVNDFVRENEERIKREKENRRKQEELAEKACERLNQQEEARRKRLLCIGEWGEKVPRNRRFALCEKARSTDGKPEYCAIDLVRGAMSPYWGYYGTTYPIDSMRQFYHKNIKPILEADGEAELVSKLSYDWDFFFIKDETDLKTQFSVLTYDVDENGVVKILSKSEPKTWVEHMNALKKEFENA